MYIKVVKEIAQVIRYKPEIINKIKKMVKKDKIKKELPLKKEHFSKKFMIFNYTGK